MIKKNTLIFLLVIIFSKNLFSQVQENKCDCLNNLNSLVAKTEENYAGFPAKVNDKTFLRYKALILGLKGKTSTEKNPKNCFYLLKEYIRFFKDKHFLLSYNNDKDYDNENIKYSEKYFKDAVSKNNLTKIEGIWINADSSLKLAIRKFPQNIYKGIVLESKNEQLPVGLVYFTLLPSKSGFIAKEYNLFITTDIPAKQTGNLLKIWNHNMFGKIYPNELNKSEREELNTWKDNNAGLAFQKLSAKTTILKIPTFFNNDAKIQGLVSKNDSLIRACDNLIIDLTGNGGGNTGWISFLPYFMTNPIIQSDTYLRITPDNVKSKLADLEPFANSPIPEEYKKYFPEKVIAAYKKAYRELPKTNKTFYPIPSVTFPLDSVILKPKRIALVVDDLCGSSTEYFFSISKQSKKTTTYGVPTIGMMDYEGMSNPTALPYNKYVLTIPISKSSWTDNHPIDQSGF